MAPRMLKKSTVFERGRVRSRLSKIHYQKGRIIVHKDPRLMPARKEDWRTFNIREDGPKAGINPLTAEGIGWNKVWYL